VPQEEIVDGYLEDLEFYRQYTGGRQVSSIFFGGGTPSLMEPRQVGRLTDYIDSVWGLTPEAEISLEANPNSHYPQMFADLRRAGINRLSLGVQALNDDDLRFLGRTHNLKQAYAAVDEVLKNFDNHSIDLIYARPNQSLSSWEKELKQAAAMGLKHISLYQLTIEDGTVFSRKGIKPLDDEAAAEMYLVTENLLQSFNYQKYEVSNYALPGFESRHNLLYWTGQDYIGVGPSAHGRLTVFNGDLKQNSGARNSRTAMYAQVSALRDSTLSPSLKAVKSCSDDNLKQNSGTRNSRAHDSLKQNLLAPVFYATTHRCRLEKISAEERAEELLLMGLRLVSGIDKAAFEKNCGIRLDDFVNRRHLTDLAAGGWLEDSPLFLRATAKGFPVLNFLIEQLVNR
jgi:putative coproporphyrinogen dehydrogenase